MQALQKSGWFSWIMSFLQSKEEQPMRLNLEELEDWLKVKSKEVTDNYNLVKETEEHLELLEKKEKYLRVKLKEWETKANQVDIEEKHKIWFFLVGLKKNLDFVKKFKLAETGNISLLNLRLKKRNTLIIDKLEKTNFAHDFDFFLNENEEGVIINPLLKELLEFGGLLENYDQKITSSGLRKLEILSKRKEILETSMEQFKTTYHLLKSKKERLGSLTVKREARKKELSNLKKEFALERKNLSPLSRESFLLKIDDVRYRFEHFKKQTSKLEKEIPPLEEEIEYNKLILMREKGLFQGLMRVGFDKKIEIKF